LKIPSKSPQKLCFICHKPEIDPQNDLIFPCLCNMVTHRRCLKKYIIGNCEMGCEKCRTNYAIGRSSKFILNQMRPKLITSLLWKIFKIFVLCLAISGIIIYLSTMGNMTGLQNQWRIFLYTLDAVLFLLTLVYMFLAFRLFCKRLGMKDIEVFCYQTEIAKHNKDSRRILTDFLEKMQVNQYEVSDLEEPKNTV